MRSDMMDGVLRSTRRRRARRSAVASACAIALSASGLVVLATAAAPPDRGDVHHDWKASEAPPAVVPSDAARPEALAPRVEAVGPSVSFSDPSGDQTGVYSQADVLGGSIGLDATGTNLVVTAKMRRFTSPASTSWRYNRTFVDWPVDTNGDGKIDYELVMFNYFGVVRARVFSTAANDVVCEGTPTSTAVTATLSMKVPLGCVQFARFVRAFVHMEYWSGTAKSIDEAPDSVWSGTLTTGNPPSPPGKPFLVSSFVNIAAEWTAPASPGPFGLAAYLVETSNDGGRTWNPVNDQSLFTTRDITNYGRFSTVSVRVAARGIFGVSAWSPVATVEPVHVLNQPVGFHVAPYDGGAEFTWSTAADLQYKPYLSVVEARLLGAPGVTATTPVAGGTGPGSNPAPWQVALDVGSPASFCGGALVDPSWVITAAHCVNGAGLTPADIVAHTGMTKRSQMNAGNAIAVDEIHINPGWDPVTSAGDVAMLHLTQPAAGEAVKIPQSGGANVPSVMLSGWGLTTTGGIPSDELSAVDAKPEGIGNNPCAALYGDQFDYRTLICGTAEGAGLCQGDDGGPMVVVGEYGMTLIGVNSRPASCGSPSRPAVYAMVGTAADWIRGLLVGSSPWFIVSPAYCGPGFSTCNSLSASFVNGSTYEFRVFHTQGYASYSGPVTIGGAAPTAPVTAPTFTAAVGRDGSVHLEWTEPPADELVTHYQLSSDGGVTWPTVVDSVVPSFDVTHLTNGVDYSFMVRAVNHAGVGPASAASPVARPVVRSFVSTSLARAMDTRPTGATVDKQFMRTGALLAGTARGLRLAGRPALGVPTGSAVALHVTTDVPAAAGSLYVYPRTTGSCTTSPRPAVPNVTFAAGVATTSLVVQKLGASGDLCFKSSATTNVMVDVLGYFPSGAAFAAMGPTRASSGAMAANSVRTVSLAGRVPSDAQAAFVKVSGAAAANGAVTLYPCDRPRPPSPSMWPIAGRAVAGTVLVPASATGTLCVHSTVALSSLTLDLVGYSPGNGYFTSRTPARVLDSRGSGSTVDGVDAKVGTSNMMRGLGVRVAGRAGVPSTATSVAIRVTVPSQPTGGVVKVAPCGSSTAVTITFEAGRAVTNELIVKPGSQGKVCVRTGQATDVIVDVDGWFSKS